MTDHSHSETTIILSITTLSVLGLVALAAYLFSRSASSAKPTSTPPLQVVPPPTSIGPGAPPSVTPAKTASVAAVPRNLAPTPGSSAQPPTDIIPPNEGG